MNRKLLSVERLVGIKARARDHKAMTTMGSTIVDRRSGRLDLL